MAQVISRVQITDFDRFFETFSTRGAEKRREHGSRGALVFRNAEDPYEVITIFDWDREGLDSFMADPEVPGVMEAAGLKGPPEFTYVEPAADLPA